VRDAGTKLKQKKALVVPASAPLDILEDEDLAIAQPIPREAVAQRGTLRQRLDASDLEEHLQQDPLRLHKVCWLDPHLYLCQDNTQSQEELLRILLCCVQDPSLAAKQEMTTADVAPSKRLREEHLAWDADILLDAEGNEMSFEEV
jgi:hypothetical protein